jgi:hypothetical protein
VSEVQKIMPGFEVSAALQEACAYQSNSTQLRISFGSRISQMSTSPLMISPMEQLFWRQ